MLVKRCAFTPVPFGFILIITLLCVLADAQNILCLTKMHFSFTITTLLKGVHLLLFPNYASVCSS